MEITVDNIRLFIIIIVMLMFIIAVKIMAHCERSEDANVKSNYFLQSIFYIIAILSVLSVRFFSAYLIPFGFIFLALLFLTNLYETIAVLTFLCAAIAMLCGQNSFLYVFMSTASTILLFCKKQRKMFYGRKLIVLLFLDIMYYVAFELLGRNSIGPEDYLGAVFGLFLNVILMAIACRIYQVYRWENPEYVYKKINNPEHELLLLLSQNFPEEFMLSVQVANQCEKLAEKLELDINVAKALGYYHRIGILKGKDIKASTMSYAYKYDFSQKLTDCLRQYYEAKTTPPTSGEVVICILTRDIISARKHVESQKDDQTDKVVDYVFQKRMAQGLLDNCNLTMGSITEIKRLIKDNKNDI